MTVGDKGRGGDVSDAVSDTEKSRLGRRVRRYAQVGAGVGGMAAKVAGQRLFGSGDQAARARELKNMLGGLKGPIMKVAQMMATIPDFLPVDYAAELAELQAAAPPMGWVFVKRRMVAELGRDWQKKFSTFEREAAAAASLGQVHRATSLEGVPLAVKLQYPDMQSAVSADLKQLSLVFAVHRQMDKAVDTSEMQEEIAARLYEELDYGREAAHMALYGAIFDGTPEVRVPEAVEALSTDRLLTMNWLDGRPLLDFREVSQERRNEIATCLFTAWWRPFSELGVIHGDPHLGNYTVRDEGGINLLDYGCIRTFQPAFVEGVVALYRALQADDRDGAVAAFESWGFRDLSNELIDVLSLWARFIYGPMLEDRVRSLADGVGPGEYGRKEAFAVHQALQTHGPVRPPREFVFMDRAAIGLGSVFLHLKAELNFHRLFNDILAEAALAGLGARQKAAFATAGVPLPL